MKIRMHCSKVNRTEHLDGPLDEVPIRMRLVDSVELWCHSPNPFHEFGGVEMKICIDKPELIGAFRVGKDYEITIDLDALLPPG